LEDVRDAEKRFPLPHGWEWMRVGKYLEVNRGASPRPKGDPRYFAATRTPYHWVKIGDLRLHGRNNVLCDTEEFLTEEGAEMSVLAPKGTVVITNSATIGIPIVMGIDGYIHDGFLSFPHFPNEFLSRAFFLLGLQSLSSHLMSEARGLAQLNMNSNIMREALLAIPPLAEQYRIVAKVEELMGLCDALTALLLDAQMTQVNLADAVVERAIS
jgi:type I restriction enzyme S subunit